jgi:hypothetical protein
VKAISKLYLIRDVSSVVTNDPELVTGIQATPEATLSQGNLFLGSHCEVILGN